MTGLRSTGLGVRITEYVFLDGLVFVGEAYIEPEVLHFLVSAGWGPSVMSHSIDRDHSAGSMAAASAMDENRLIRCAIRDCQELPHAVLAGRSGVGHRNMYEFHSRSLDLLALLG